MSERMIKAAVRKYAPLAGDVAPDLPSTVMSVGYMDKDTQYLLSRMGNMGVIKSPDKKGSYFVHSKADSYRARAGKVGNSGPTPLGEHNVTEATYDCDIYGLHTKTPTVIAAMAKPPLNLERDDAEYVGDGMMLARDLDFASTVFTASPAGSTWGTSWAGASSDSFGAYQAKYFNQAGSKPVEVITRMRKAITTANGGKRPNVMIMGPDVDVALQNNADLIDRHPGASQVILGESDYASIFKIPNVFVADMPYNTAPEDESGTVTMTDMFGKSIWLGYVEPNPGLKKRSAYYRFDWVNMPDSVEGMQVKRYIEKRDIITEALSSWVTKIVDLSSGGFLSLCVE